MYLTKESIRLFHDNISESVDDMINKAIQEAVNRQKEAEERRRREEEEKEKEVLYIMYPSNEKSLIQSFKNMV